MKDARTLLKHSEIIEVLNFATPSRATRSEWKSLNRKIPLSLLGKFQNRRLVS